MKECRQEMMSYQSNIASLASYVTQDLKAWVMQHHVLTEHMQKGDYRLPPENER